MTSDATTRGDDEGCASVKIGKPNEKRSNGLRLKQVAVERGRRVGEESCCG